MLLILDPDESYLEHTAAALREAGLPTVPMRARDVEELRTALAAEPPPTAVVFGPGAASQAADVAVGLPSSLTMLLVAVPTTATLRAAMRAGIRDVLAPSSSGSDLLEALGAAGWGTAADGGELPGATIAVFSTKGGVGTSVVASNLALRLAERAGADTVLADLDLASADQSVLHGLRPSWTLQDLADGSIGDDRDALEQVLLPVQDSRLRLLAGPTDPAAAETIDDAVVHRVLHQLRCIAPLLVVDTSSAFSDATLAVLERADVIVLVVSLDVLSLRSLTVALHTLDRLGIERARLRVVVSRADAKVGLTTDDVTRTAGSRVDVQLPSSRDVARSVNTAAPLALRSPRSAYVRAIDGLVDSVTADPSVPDGIEVDDQRRGLFGRLRPSSRSSVTVAEDGRGSAATNGHGGSPQERVAAPTATSDGDVGGLVIHIADAEGRLAALPPPVVETTPHHEAEAGHTRGRRRDARK